MTNPSPRVTRKISKKTGKTIARRPGQERYDWDAIRRDFIEGVPVTGTKNERRWPTLRELSDTYTCPYERVRKRSAAERWTENKASHQIVAEEERAKVRARQIAGNALDFDEKTYNAAKLGIGLVLTRLAEIGQEVQAKKPARDDAMKRLAAGQHVTRDELYSAIHTSHLSELANAAERFQNLGQKALGTDVQRVDITGAETTVNIVNVQTELARDDAERTAGVIEAMADAGFFPQELLEAMQLPDEDDDVIEGEVVDAPNEDEDAVDGDYEESDEVDDDNE